jgi:ATP-dependent Clp protease protease subunit
MGGTGMRRTNREDLDRWFDYSVYAPKRLIYIGDRDGEVDANMHELAIKGLLSLDSWADAPITIYLNSLGGDWYHGMGIYDTIRALRSHVTIIVVGSAMSMGSVILQAGDVRILSPHSYIMIHDGSDDVEADSKSFEAWAAQGKVVRYKMYDIYLRGIKAKKPRFTKKQVEALCAHDTILSASETIEYGLADQILEKLF